MSALNPRLLINSTPPPPQLCPISLSLILILLPLFSLLSHSKVPVQELYKGGGGQGGEEGGWVGGGRHGFLTMATDKRLQSIEEFPHISWIIGALRERLSFETNAGYHQDPGRGWSPTAIFIFFPFIFFLFLTEWGSCFLWAYSPLQFHSSLVLAFLPLFPFLSFFEKESLCVTPFLPPLCYAVHIVTQWRTESRQWVWSSGSSSVLLVTWTPMLQLFYLGLICQQDQEFVGS